MYAVEFQGFNDGVPYEEFRTDDLARALVVADTKREERPKVKWRVVEIIEDFS